MNATTVNEFAQRCAELAGAIIEVKPRKAELAVASRVLRLAVWLSQKSRERGMLNADVRVFMERCSEAVRERAREAVREAQAVVKAMREAQAKKEAKAMSKAIAAEEAAAAAKAEAEDKTEAVAEAKPQNMSDEDFEEYLQKVGPFEAARILREVL